MGVLRAPLRQLRAEVDARRAALDRGWVELDAATQSGTTALMIACANGHAACGLPPLSLPPSISQ